MLDIDQAPGAINGLSVLGIVMMPLADVIPIIAMLSTPMMIFLCMVVC